MGTYTVKAGDNLSSIGASQGVDWKSITGYSSGNPNLIRPGEVLSWGGGAAPKPTATSAAPNPPAQAVNTNSSQALTGELNTFDQNAQNPIDVYNSALNKLGITDARTRVTDLRKSLVDNQNLLDNLSGNIQQRTSGALVTESQRQRLQSTEAAPIAEMGNKLNQQFGLAQGDYQGIMGEGRTQADLTISGQSSKRNALLDRLKIAIDNEDNIEKKRQWQKTYDQAVAKDKQDQANTDRDFNLKLKESNKPSNNSSVDLAASKNSAGGYSITENGVASKEYDLASYAKATGKDLIGLLSNGDAKDRQAAKWFKDNIRLGRGEAYAWDRLRNYDRPTAFHLGG